MDNLPADTFNISISQFETLTKYLNEKQIGYWDVSEQWNMTHMAKYKTYFGNVLPYKMYILKLLKRVVVIVWKNDKYYKLDDRHSLNDIITYATTKNKSYLRNRPT
jgi:hypothetical protein